MDWLVVDLVECPSVSRTSAVARTFGPAVSEEYSPVHVTQTTASVWMPCRQTCNGVSGDADFDSFEMAPWDAGGIQGDRFHEVMCRTIVHKLDRWTTRNTENRLDMMMLIDTDSPQLTITPGECHASYGGTQIGDNLQQTHDASAMADDCTRRKDDMILRRPAECNENFISTDMDSSAVILNDVTFRWLILPWRQVSAEHDKTYARASAGRDMLPQCRLRGS